MTARHVAEENHLEHLRSVEHELVHSHIERITALEEKVIEHGKVLATLAPSVAAIENHLRAIKWTCCGALGFYLTQKLGFLEGVKLLLKL